VQCAIAKLNPLPTDYWEVELYASWPMFSPSRTVRYASNDQNLAASKP
jgi:hypothetical protein